MAQQNTTPVAGKKRKLPSFMTAPTRWGLVLGVSRCFRLQDTQRKSACTSRIESSKSDAHEQQRSDRSVKSPKPKVTRKQTRQTQLPLQRAHRSAKTPAQDHLYVSLGLTCLPFPKVFWGFPVHECLLLLVPITKLPVMHAEANSSRRF